MSRMIHSFLLLILIAILLPAPAGAAPAGVSAAKSAEAKVLLERVSSLDREISRTLLKVVRSGKLPEKPNRPGLRPYDGYRAHLNQLRIQASRLDRPQQEKVRRAIRTAWKKAALLQREVKNQKLFVADKQRAMRRQGLAPNKPAKKAAPHASGIPTVAPPNDNCANATPVNEGSFQGDTTGATNDGSESCVGDASEDIWYAYTATVTAPVRVDTFGSDFDTVLSAHTPPCPGTPGNEIVCDDDCIGVTSCVTISAVAGNTYLIRVGGFGVGDTGNVQLHIVPAGAVSGTVTTSDTSLPLQGVELDFFTALGNYAGYTLTDANGQYTSDALSSGTYFVLAYGSNGYLDKLYDNIPCNFGNCDILSGTPVTVDAGATTTGINFVLDPGGSISGALTDETTNNPIPYAGVEIYDENGGYAAYGYTDALGKYKVDGLLTGTYFARTNSYGNYADELFDNIPCLSYCDPTTGTPISVIQGQTTGGISFALQQLGQITGRVTDEATGAGISDVEIDIMDTSGDFLGYGYTDSTGRYTATGLPTGTYYAMTNNYSPGYIDELYDNISCPNGNCDPFTGTPISVVNATTTSGINFALVHGGTIVGRITKSGGQPLGNASISIFDVNADQVSYGYTDASGYYAAGGLPTGTYYAYANEYGYVGEMYNDFPCPNLSCSPTAGAPIAVTVSQIVTGINFMLTEGGRIGGAVTDSVSHQPITYAGIDIYDSSGNWMAYGYTDSNGQYIAGGLLTGNYFATVNTYGDYLGELYDNIPCPNGNCDVLTGTPIPVTLSQETPNINFALDRGGSISGTLTDASNSDPLPYFDVYIYDSNNNHVAYGYTDTSGAYSATGLAAGNYFAVTDTYGDYVDEVYNNIPCMAGLCDPVTGTPIPVALSQNTAGIDFALDHGGSVSGVVTDDATALPLSDAWVTIYNSDGNFLNYGYTDSVGHYTLGGLVTGSYFVLAGSSNHLTELYDNHPCLWAQCNVTTGDPVPVTLNVNTSGIDFALGTGGSISGTVTDAVTHQPLSYAYIYIQDSSGASSSESSDSFGHFTVQGLTTGTYYLVASYGGYTPQLYQGIPCPNFDCVVTNGTPVTVTAPANTPGIDFALDPGGSIHGTVTRESNGAPLRYMNVSIYDSTGNQISYGYTDSTGAYTVQGLGAGTYYVAVSGYTYASELYNNIPCPGLSCDVLSGTPVLVVAETQTNGIDFAMAAGNAVRGVVRDASSGAPLGDALVKILKSTGEVVITGYTDYEGKYRLDGLADGTYYVMATGSAGHVDQLYNGVPCPDGSCVLTTGTPVPLAAGSTANGINFPLATDTCMYCDDFEGGQLPDWTYLNPAWSETGGNLVGTPAGKKAMAVATPAFQGCSICSIDMTVQISGGAQSKVWLMGWYSGKSTVELLMKGDKNRWILKERVRGFVVQKAKSVKTIDPDTPYRVHMVFDGAQVKVFVDDLVNPLITMTPTAPPSGSFGLAVKGTIASFGYLDIN